jgi:hypothetical protein
MMTSDQSKIERLEKERSERIEKSLRRFETSLNKPRRHKKWSRKKGRTGGANDVENQEVTAT